MIRVKDWEPIRFWKSAWHSWFGHPAADLVVTGDYRSLSPPHIFYKCLSCGIRNIKRLHDFTGRPFERDEKYPLSRGD